MKTKSANGTTGCLIWVMDGLTSRYVFRVYKEDGQIRDYELKHTDLFITINDDDAYFYKNKDGVRFLDHSPKTLGKNYE